MLWLRRACSRAYVAPPPLADYAAAGYEAYPPSSQLHKECKPYKLSEAQFFVDVSVASLRTISGGRAAGGVHC